MRVQKLFVNALAAIVFVALVVVLFQSWDSMPEMAWSHSRNSCVSVMQQGKVIPDGCERVARGELRAEVYPVK